MSAKLIVVKTQTSNSACLFLNKTLFYVCVNYTFTSCAIPGISEWLNPAQVYQFFHPKYINFKNFNIHQTYHETYVTDSPIDTKFLSAYLDS